VNETAPIRVGIVGAGTNTRERHIPGLARIEGVEIVRVCNRTNESSRRAAQAFGIPSYSDNWRDVTDADDLDAVVIGTWPYLHRPITIAALDGGKHVLCEARMAMNSKEAHAMLDAARRNPSRVAMVVPSPFTLGIDETIQRMVSQGWFGEIVSIEVRALAGDFPDAAGPLHWRENRDLSGNNMLSLGIWYEALMRWVGEAKRVTAFGRTVIRSRKDLADGVERGITVPDHLDVVAEMYSGAQLHMQLSSVARHPGGPEVWLYGTDGIARFTEDRLEAMQRGEAALEEVVIPKEHRKEWRVEEEFIGAIRGAETVRLTTFEDGVRYMEFTDAVHESILSGRSVSLPLTGRLAG
jgi:predicted dehydrogenase